MSNFFRSLTVVLVIGIVALVLALIGEWLCVVFYPFVGR